MKSYLSSRTSVASEIARPGLGQFRRARRGDTKMSKKGQVAKLRRQLKRWGFDVKKVGSHWQFEHQDLIVLVTEPRKPADNRAIKNLPAVIRRKMKTA